MVNNVYAQIGLVMLIGLAAKNAILIVEFARLEFEEGKPLIEAALTGARLRLRPILMTSFAFILGSVPLWCRHRCRRGVAARPGTVVIGGMLAATCVAIFLIPVTFYVVERLARSQRELESEPNVSPGRPGARRVGGMTAKSEARSPKSETNSNAPKATECRKPPLPASFEPWPVFERWRLFRISGFGFRVSCLRRHPAGRLRCWPRLQAPSHPCARRFPRRGESAMAWLSPLA